MDEPPNEPKQPCPHKAVGERIAAARDALGLTQEDLADSMKVTAITISRWERGRFLPDLNKHLPRLAAALRVSPDALITMSDLVRADADATPDAAE